jgi:hypothetical protein
MLEIDCNKEVTKLPTIPEEEVNKFKYNYLKSELNKYPREYLIELILKDLKGDFNGE